MESSPPNTHQSFNHQTHQPNSGLLRFRSAPSTLFMNFTGNGDCVGAGVGKNNSMDGSESARLFSRFVNFNGTVNNDSESSPTFQDFDDKSSVMAAHHRYNSTGLPPHYPRQSSSMTSSAMDNGSFGLVGSMAMDSQTQAKSVNSNLVRQSSSPAGLFSHTSVPNGIVLDSLYEVSFFGTVLLSWNSEQ